MNSSGEPKLKRKKDKQWWILQRFEHSPGHQTSIDEIIASYDQEKENLCFQIKRKEVLRLLSEVFGDRIHSYRPRLNGKQVLTFVNVSKKDSTYHDTNNEYTDEVLQSCGWVVRNRTLSTIEVSKFTGIIVDQREFVLNVDINVLNLNFNVTALFGRQYSNVELGCPSHGCSIPFLLQYLSKLTLCSGIKIDETAVVRNMHKDPKCIPANINGKSVFFSRQCSELVFKSGEVCAECTECERILKKRKPVYSNIMKTKNALLSDEEKKEKMDEILRLKNLSNKKLKYWQKKFQDAAFVLDEEDHRDITDLLKDVRPEKLNPEMLLLFEQQEMALKRDPKGHRWHPKIIRLCLDLYSSSSKAYDTLKTHLILPSKRLIRYYKNSIPNFSGWNEDVLRWCHKEIHKLDVKEEDVWSGLIFDEMTIQEDIEFVKIGGKKKITGAVELGASYEDARFLVEGNNDTELSSKVMQFAIVTDSGFRFALAHFPVKVMPATILLEKFWQGVELCERFGFRIYWLLCDGGEPNRSFVNLLFPSGSDPEEHKFTAYNRHTGGQLAVLLDPKHNFKKIRNHLEKSTTSDKSPRRLTVNNSIITFSLWKDAYHWDRDHHSLPIHEKLTDSHFELTPSSRMRNHLAEDVLNSKMLDLMKNYKTYLLKDKPTEAAALDEPIKFLGYTSKIVDLFSRKDPILSPQDPRVQTAEAFLRYLSEWKSQVTEDKEFLSHQLWFDLRSMIIGFRQAVSLKTRTFPGKGIKPVMVNQDLLENIFCQVRSFNGQNNHPKYYMYSSLLKSVNLGQSILSKKGNTNGNTEALPKAGLPSEHPFRKRH